MVDTHQHIFPVWLIHTNIFFPCGRYTPTYFLHCSIRGIHRGYIKKLNYAIYSTVVNSTYSTSVLGENVFLFNRARIVKRDATSLTNSENNAMSN